MTDGGDLDITNILKNNASPNKKQNFRNAIKDGKETMVSILKVFKEVKKLKEEEEKEQLEGLKEEEKLAKMEELHSKVKSFFFPFFDIALSESRKQKGWLIDEATIQLAVEMGDPHIVEALLDDVHRRDTDKRINGEGENRECSAIDDETKQLAVGTGDIDKTNPEKQEGGSIRKHCMNAFKQLLGSSEKGTAVAMAPLLLQHISWEDGFSTVFEKEKRTEIMSFVVRSGNTELAKHCLEMFVDKFDHHEEDGSNYLHLACWYGHTDIANLLIDKYIELKMTEELTKENNKSESPLANAVMGGIDGSTLMRLVPFYERNTTNLIDRLKYWMANTWEMVKRNKDLIDILKKLTLYEDCVQQNVEATNKHVTQDRREEGEKVANSSDPVPAVNNSDLQKHAEGEEEYWDLNGYNSNCIRELNEYLSDMPSGRVSEWFYDTKLHVSSLFQWEPSPPSRNRLKELITKLWVRVNKLIDDLVTIQDPANRDTTCEGHLAALIGSNPDLALEMFLSTWIYTSHEFYVASSFRTTLSSFVRGEDNDSVKERVKFMHPLLYYLRQMLMRLHTEFRIQRRGEKEMKPEMMGDKITIPTFMSTSGSLAMALAFSNTCVLMVLGSGASIREVSAPPSEDEYLFRPGISYRVLKVFNPSMLRLLGCQYDLAVLIQESAGRSYVEKRETEIRLIREASVEMINILYKGFESRYVEPRFQKSMSCVGEQVDLNKIKERFNNKEEMRPLLLQADGGGGKTSAVIRLAKDLSESKSEDEKRLPFFPIYVSMMCIENAFKEHAIDDYIMSQCLTSICTVHNILKQFVLVVVLDSFDEGLGIGEAATADGKQQTLLELNPTLLAKSWVVVTCRTERLTRRGLTPSSLLGGSIDSYFLLPFDISQKEELAEKLVKDPIHFQLKSKGITKDKVIDILKAHSLWYGNQSPQLLYKAFVKYVDG